MLAIAIWWTGICLECAILAQAFRSKIFSKYPVFFFYLAFVLVSDLSRFIVYGKRPDMYQYWWWATEFVGVLLGYYLIINILENVLHPYPGARKFARNAGLLIFAGIVIFTASQWIVERRSSLAITSIEVERNLRSAEAILLCVLLLVVAYYGVSLGRNLRGILVGYGLYIALDLMIHAARTLWGQSFQDTYSKIRSYSYLATLLIWIVALWSYSPISLPVSSLKLEADYQTLASSTKDILEAIRSYLGRAGRK